MSDSPHPSAVRKEKKGLEWWEWRRPEDGVLQIQLTGKGMLSDAETDKLAGEFLDDSSYVILASKEDVDIYKPEETNALDLLGGHEDNPESRLLVSLRKRALPEKLLKPAHSILRHAAGVSKNRGYAAGKATAEGLGKDPSRFVSHGGATAGYLTEDGYLSRTSESNQVLSGIVGNFNWTPRNPYCRQTSFTRDHLEEFQMAMPLIEAINASFRKQIPGRWDNQRRFLEEHSLGEKGWALGGTVFSTITVNKNYRTGVHKDAGDFWPGFGNLTVLEGGKHKYKGGRTVFPKFRCAVDLRNGDFLGMDVHEWHGNTQLYSAVEGEDDWERISVVCYVRVEMIHCGTVAEEAKKHASWLETYKNPMARHADLISDTELEKAEAQYYSGLLGVVGDIPKDESDAVLSVREEAPVPLEPKGCCGTCGKGDHEKCEGSA